MSKSREFARAYAAEVARAPKRQEPEPVREFSEDEIKVFAEGSDEFARAVKKVPPQLLDLFYSQFRIKPARFVEGGIAPEKIAEPEAAPETEDSAIAAPHSFEEEDSE